MWLKLNITEITKVTDLLKVRLPSIMNMYHDEPFPDALEYH